MLHLEHYVELFDIFKEASKQSCIAIARITSKLSTVEKWLEDKKLSDTSIVELLNFDIDTSKDEKELASLTIELQNISEKNKKISKNNQYKSIMSTIDIASINESSVKQLQSYDNLQSEVGSLNAIAAGAQRLLHKLEGLGDTCPTCEQPVDNSFKQSLMGAEVEKTISATTRMKELMNEIERIKENNNIYTQLTPRLRKIGKTCIGLLTTLYRVSLWTKDSLIVGFLAYRRHYKTQKTLYIETLKGK